MGFQVKDMVAKMIDAEGGDPNKEVQSLGNSKSLKRPFDAIDPAEDEHTESDKEKLLVDVDATDGNDDADEYSDPDDMDVYPIPTPIHNSFENQHVMRMYAKLEGRLKDGDPLLDLFNNILMILKKENSARDDADNFSKIVKQVLMNDNIITLLTEEFENPWTHLALSYSSGLTDDRVVSTQETTEERIARIRDDVYFGEASAGKNRSMVVSGVMSIIFGYCVTPAYLIEMIRMDYMFTSREKSRFQTPIWL